ncbi:hypothetical protein [Aquimarina pacifica]|uniref:hypothetical protein n=1 Tax=Aquimarina pacifica TaxID=1296415 RepID=UPI00047222CB|nr:hypothetical protein [Aquimarina pacifica]
MSNKYTRKHFNFILQSLLSAILLYALTGFILAFIVVTFFGSEHPHNIDGILYFIIPILYGNIGIVLGIIFSLIYISNCSFSKVVKYLLLGLLLLVLLSMLFFFIQ